MTFRDSLTDDPSRCQRSGSPSWTSTPAPPRRGRAGASPEVRRYTLDEQSHLTVTDENTDSNPNAPSDLWFHSTPAYNPASFPADNPTDPSALTETQKRLAVSFVFLATSQVSLG